MFRLFRHRPTQRWLPIIQGDHDVTPGLAYVPDLAREYGVPEDEIEVVNQIAVLPEDLETNHVPRAVAPPTPEQIEHESAFAQLDTLIDRDQIDALIDRAITQAQSGDWTWLGMVLKRLAKGLGS